ncbi:trypsin-like serine peptidase [Verrucomicrobiota bacterium sgz303538]
MKRLVALLSLALAVGGITSQATDYPTQLAKATAARQPFNLIGQVYFASGGDDYIGSGIAIRPRSILTAGHNLYDPDNGWSTDLLFRRGAYGDTVRSEQYAKQIYLLGGYRQSANHYGTSSIRTFASDTGGIRFSGLVANGASAAWAANPSLLTDNYRAKIAVGYGAEGQHSGDFPLYVIPDVRFSSTWGSFYESRGASFEGGMSGGPVFALGNDGKYYVAAIVVSGSDYPIVEGGIRVIDRLTASFIRNYLR